VFFFYFNCLPLHHRIAGTHYQFLWYMARVFLPGRRQLCRLSALVQPSHYADILTQKVSIRASCSVPCMCLLWCGDAVHLIRTCGFLFWSELHDGVVHRHSMITILTKYLLLVPFPSNAGTAQLRDLAVRQGLKASE
jgi:hypothetical protein